MSRMGTMVEFDQLPQTNRSLILATLALDIATINCRNIFDLALRRKQTVHEVWRDICRRTAQPRCTMPKHLLESRYTSADFYRLIATAPAVERAAGATASARSVSIEQFGDLVAVTRAPPATPAPRTAAITRRPSTPQAKVPAPSGSNRRLVMAASGAAALVLGVAIALMGTRTLQTAPLDGSVRASGGNSQSVASAPALVSVPEPQGTARRMDAISKSFSKR